MIQGAPCAYIYSKHIKLYAGYEESNLHCIRKRYQHLHLNMFIYLLCINYRVFLLFFHFSTNTVYSYQLCAIILGRHNCWILHITLNLIVILPFIRLIRYVPLLSYFLYYPLFKVAIRKFLITIYLSRKLVCLSFPRTRLLYLIVVFPQRSFQMVLYCFSITNFLYKKKLYRCQQFIVLNSIKCNT